jgi:hypothetical protein
LKKRKLDRGKLQEIITWRDTSNWVNTDSAAFKVLSIFSCAFLYACVRTCTITLHEQTNNLSFMPWEEDALSMHNHMHKQTTHHSLPWEEDSPSVWTFTMTCTSRQTTSIAMRSILLRFGSSQSHAQTDKQPTLPWKEDSRSRLHNDN